eukprot:TRINITY_DN18825_c0_g1_i1.p1 TRINITY_DN18825_c0_g1~~TRINITY_DN18825_c0_g1_i1.p1  ORF type:complete len:501 (+),score=86.48 TRINITY_DN18825_c0_g1_i1:25-1527(+)
MTVRVSLTSVISGKEAIISTRTFLGRGPLLGIDNKRLSRQQAELIFENNSVFLVSLGVNSTFLTQKHNPTPEKMITGKQYSLNDGDVITFLGNQDFRVSITNDEDQKSILDELDDSEMTPVFPKSQTKIKDKDARSIYGLDSEDEEMSEDDRPSCQFGIKCYRKNPQHYQEAIHPKGHPLSQPKEKKRKMPKILVDNFKDDVFDGAMKIDTDSTAVPIVRSSIPVEKKIDTGSLNQDQHKAIKTYSSPHKDLKNSTPCPIVSSFDEEEEVKIKYQPERKKLFTPLLSLNVFDRSSQQNASDRIGFDLDLPREGSASIGISILGTSSFQFDENTAALIAAQEIKNFLNKHSELDQLRIVITEQDAETRRLFKKHCTIQDHRLIFSSAHISNLKTDANIPCSFLVNPTNWRFKGGFIKDKQIFEVVKTKYNVGKCGKAYEVVVPESSRLYTIQDVRLIIYVIPPNMNPNKANCLNGDYEKGRTLLQLCYRSIFQAFEARLPE